MGKNARTFGQDLMRGEHTVARKKHSNDLRAPEGEKLAMRTSTDPYREQTASLKGGTTFGLTAHPYDASADTEPTAAQTGTSIFDPVLCELAYRWFVQPGGIVLDPFAGGSVRGIVASRLGRYYVGCELRPEQVSANRAQAAKICEGFPGPLWHEGDSAVTIPALDLAADFVFSCPPYGDLEIYSDRDDDLSAMSHTAFIAAYRKIIAAAVSKLRDDRFACFVVGDFRDKRGFYRNFVSDTIAAFEAAGAGLYNEIILVTAAGSLPIRAGKQFSATRKVGKTHQNVLVFCKGDPVRATKACGKVEIDKTLFAAMDQALAEAGEGESDEPARPVDKKSNKSGSVAPRAPQPELVDFTPDLTPIEQHDAIWVKRDDLWAIAGVAGGKVRTCWHLAQAVLERAPGAGLVTAGSRASPQVNIVAHIARRLGVPCRAHTPQGDLSPEVAAAQAAGAEIIQHKAGYNNVIVARARSDAAALGWIEIPFGMECEEATRQTRTQVRDIPEGVRRIVMPVGSGMSAAGVLWGLHESNDERLQKMLVVGVVVGADPEKRLDKYAPPGWRDMMTLLPAGVDYHSEVEARVGPVLLDPVYEAKCARFLEPGDLLWIVGIRATA